MLNFDPNIAAEYSEPNWTIGSADDFFVEEVSRLRRIVRAEAPRLREVEQPSRVSRPVRTEIPLEFISGFCAAG